MVLKKLQNLEEIISGIAAYKTPYLIRLLIKNNIEVKVVLTNAAKGLVGADTMRTVSQNPIYSDTISSEYDMDHIRLAQWADLFLICPGTANTLAKMAHGLADNLLTTLALSFKGQILIAPAMNTAMWQNSATVDNIKILTRRGLRVLPVTTGLLACDVEGAGKMISIETIFEFILGADLPQCFTGKKILIASGPTAEPIDPVRILTNRSTGKMGAALACAAMCMGAEVSVVTGQTQVSLPEGIKIKQVLTSKEMGDTLKSSFKNTDICIMAAAISDFKPRTFSEEKIRKRDHNSLSLELVPNEDVAATLSKDKNGQYLVCFSLETDGDENRAKKKMNKKDCDMIIYNNVDSSLGKDTSKITIITPNEKQEKSTVMNKRECAQIILLSIAKKMGLL